ncbi:MAG TPA: hypothetical protein VJU61_14855 [Polyangiaceae bacterium]|nr:hypothetical protein [Polyangiaceae bacterium]
MAVEVAQEGFDLQATGPKDGLVCGQGLFGADGVDATLNGGFVADVVGPKEGGEGVVAGLLGEFERRPFARQSRRKQRFPYRETSQRPEESTPSELQ